MVHVCLLNAEVLRVKHFGLVSSVNVCFLFRLQLGIIPISNLASNALQAKVKQLLEKLE